ncbi:pilus assembly protein CpaF [Enterococcus sp. DIV1420a]
MNFFKLIKPKKIVVKSKTPLKKLKIDPFLIRRSIFYEEERDRVESCEPIKPKKISVKSKQQKPKPPQQAETKPVQPDPPVLDPVIEARIIQAVNDGIRRRYARLKIACLTSEKAKKELRQIILEEFQAELEGHNELVDKILRESVGLGVIEEILQDPTITDIVYNGTELVIESNVSKWIHDMPIPFEYMEKIVHKLANASGKEFTTKDPVLDIQFHNLRVNAVHSSLATVGLTVAFRISRSALVLTEENFPEMAPIRALSLLQACVQSMCNVVLSGETGAGKTECQKLLIQAIPFGQRIALVEDVQESHVKELFPEKDILAWHSGEKTGISELIKAGLRNNPKWIMVTEMRYAREAYEWLQGIMTDHKSITTIHAVSASDIPDRILSMILEEFPVNEERFLRNIKKYIDIGVQVSVRVVNGKKIRYINEIMYITPEKDYPLFSQRCTKDGHLYPTFCTALPSELEERFVDYGVTFDIGEEEGHVSKEKTVRH